MQLVTQIRIDKVKCYIYRSTRKQGLYIYLPRANNFSAIPAALLKKSGALELALEIELTVKSKLNREDAATVIDNLLNQGYHVQLPESIESLLNSR